LGFMLGDDELSFRGDISVVIKPSPMAPVQLVLSFDAALKGCIKNTFGFKGFDICDVAMGLSIDALRCGAGLVGCFEGIRIQGMFKFGSRKAILAVKIELSAPQNNAILGYIDNLKLTDLLNIPLTMARSAGANIPLFPAPNIPVFEIKRAEVKISAQPITIGSDTFDRGISLEFNLVLLGVRVTLDCKVDLEHVKAKSTISAFNFGPLQLGGAGCDLKRGTADDGVCLWIEMGGSSKFVFAGTFAVASFFKIDGEMNLDRSGVHLAFSLKLGLFEANVKLSSNNLQEISPDISAAREFIIEDAEATTEKQDLHLSIQLKNEAFNWLADLINKGTDRFAKILDEHIAEGNKEIGKAAQKAATCGVVKEGGSADQITTLELTEVIEMSIRRIRRRALGPDELLLIDDSAPINQPAEVIHGWVVRAQAKDEYCKIHDTESMSDECSDPYAYYQQAAQSRGADRLTNLELRTQWGAFTEVHQGFSDACKAAAKAILQHSMSAIKNAAKHMNTFAKEVGKKVGEFGTEMSAEIVKASQAVWGDLMAASDYMAKLACESMALFLDAIVKIVFTGMLNLVKFAVWTSGKLVATALQKGFNIELIEYSASMQGVLKADLGDLRLKAVVLGKRLDFDMKLALFKDVSDCSGNKCPKCWNQCGKDGPCQYCQKFGLSMCCNSGNVVNGCDGRGPWSRHGCIAPKPGVQLLQADASTKKDSDADKVGSSLESGMRKTSCDVLGSMGFGQSCEAVIPPGKASTRSKEPFDPVAVEQELEGDFSLRQDDVLVISNRYLTSKKTSTGIMTTRGRIVSLQGGEAGLWTEKTGKIASANTFVLSLDRGNKVLNYGQWFTLNDGTVNSEPLVVDQNKIFASDKYNQHSRYWFQAFNPKDLSDRGPVVDFATVAIKAKYNGKWLGATEASAVRANFDVPELTHGYTTFSIFKVKPEWGHYHRFA